MILVKAGDPLILHCQLDSLSTAKYVRARVKNPAGVELGYSPLALEHKGHGLYTNTAETMPSVQMLLVLYEVYDDASFTTLSAEDSNAFDVFVLDTAENLSRYDGFVAEFNDVQIIGELATDKSLLGAVTNQRFSGLLHPEMAFEGEMEDDDEFTGIFEIRN